MFKILQYGTKPEYLALLKPNKEALRVFSHIRKIEVPNKKNVNPWAEAFSVKHQSMTELGLFSDVTYKK